MKASSLPGDLRARLAADYQPVRALGSPWMRVLWILPLAVVALLAASIAFNVRQDAPDLGWLGVWGLSIVTVVGVTLTSWEASPIFLRAEWWLVGGICFAGSAATALPVVAFASILAARAYPTRPAVAGTLLGMGAGLMADAGWRIFCHFSEPAHVLSAHLAAVVMSTMIGALVAVRLCGLRGEKHALHEPVGAGENHGNRSH